MVKMARQTTKSTKKRVEKANQELTRKVISETIGEEALTLVEYLIGKKDISEFQIAKAINLEVGYIRHVLYKLQNNNLVTYFRKKDKIKGWYISYWTFNLQGALDLATALKKHKISQLKERLTREEENKGLFYICPKFCSRSNFDDAVESGFKCDECGSAIEHQDNEKTIERIRDTIVNLESEPVTA